MQAKPIENSPNLFEMGLSSITGMLYQMSKAEEKVSDTLIKNNQDIKDYFNTSLTEIAKNQNQNKFTPPKQTFDVVTHQLLGGINEQLSLIYSSLNDESQKSITPEVKFDILDNVKFDIPDNVKFDMKIDNNINDDSLNKIIIFIEKIASVDSKSLDNISTLFGSFDKIPEDIGKQLSGIGFALLKLDLIIRNVNFDNFDEIHEFFEKLGKNDFSADDFQDIDKTLSSIGLGLFKLSLYSKVVSGKMLSGIIDFFNRLSDIELDDKKLEKFGTSIEKITTPLKDASKLFIGLGVGLLALAGSVLVMGIAASSPGFLLGSVTLLALLWGLSKISFDGKLDKETMLGLGIGILALTGSLILFQFVSFESMMKGLVFIGALGYVLQKFKKDPGTKGILELSAGIGILTLSMIGMNAIEWQSLAKMILFIGALGLVLKVFDGRRGPKNDSSIIKFSMGIGLLTLSLFAFAELPVVALIKMIAFIGGLGLVLKLMPNGPQGMPAFALGIGILTLALFAMRELDWEPIFKMVAFVGMMAIAMRIMPKTGGPTMLMMAGAIIVMATSLAIVGASGITVEKTLLFVGSVAAIAALMVGIGVPAIATFAALGAATMIGISLSSLLIAFTIKKINDLEIDFGNVLKFIGAVGALAVGFAVLSPFAVVGLVGAILMIPIAVSTALIAGSLSIVENLEFKNISSFIDSLKTIAIGFAYITPFAASALVGSVLMVPVLASAMAGALLLTLVSGLTVNPDKIDTYMLGVKSIVDGYNSFKLKTAIGAAAKSTILLPVFGSALLGALALKSIAALNIDGDRITSFGIFVNSFITEMVRAINDNVADLKAIEPGLKGLSKLVNVGSSLVDIVTGFANMNYNIYDVKNGELVLVGNKKITDAEIQQVGVNIGKLIQGLLAPLAIISSDEDEWNFGNGVIVKNPFKGGFLGMGKNSGIKRLTKIGNAFLPLSEALVNLTSIGMLQDKAAMDSFKANFAIAIDTLIYSMNKLDEIDSKNIKKPLKSINQIIDTLNNIESEEFSSLSEAMNSFLNNLADNEKFGAISENLNKLNSEFSNIADNINRINLEKALLLEKNLKILTDEESNEKFDGIIDKLAELIDLLNIQKPEQNNTTTNKTINSSTPITDTVEKYSAMGTEKIEQILTSIAEGIGQTNTKLSQRLKVALANQPNSNKL